MKEKQIYSNASMTLIFKKNLLNIIYPFEYVKLGKVSTMRIKGAAGSYTSVGFVHWKQWVRILWILVRSCQFDTQGLGSECLLPSVIICKLQYVDREAYVS